ncbi:smad nuclear interacting protein 1 [Coprinopsis cinerea okayama7|uniref:Smad nuclear interacting protein 1 n=1 Tax=Coprinopsis cinerea (strain Okayama-7 / 130 / ATCC MYA-4618 / FGSC 9003) TaxID=240176 RepID=A8NRQ0_COPC7|nr:smad nuclear interacting protein 1 [Coprinopsis cinerea okayama7\|eukprot:XP_001835826.2 smad nuclear interacting protein 1 [Coprinopsis cinerea okayama7\
MPRDSVSPRRRSRYEDSSRRSTSSRDYERRDSRRDYGSNDERKYSDRRNRGYHDERGYSSRNSRRDSELMGYDERERERERQRDRGRYDAHADPSRRRDGRSASPRRGSRSGSAVVEDEEVKDKGKPNFKPSGLLAAETNTVKASDGTATVLKYNEPPEARKPSVGWRLYVFKGKEQLDPLHIYRQSAYLIGRDRLVADIVLDHPSCSKQHAAIQYRFVHEKDEFGTIKGVVKPFIIDLESTNGTMVNDEKIPPARYYELRASDVIKFGTSDREYVLLHDDAA